MTDAAKIFQEKAARAYDKVVHAEHPLVGQSLRDFEEYYRNAVGHQLIHLNQQPLAHVKLADQGMSIMETRFWNRLNNMEMFGTAEQKAHVAATKVAINEWKKEIHGPTMLDAVGQAFYNEKDTTAAVGGVQLDGVAGAAAGGALGFWLSTKLRLSAFWTAAVSVVGALLAAPLANGITNALKGAPEKPEKPEPVPHAPTPSDPSAHAKPHIPSGSYGMANVHMSAFYPNGAINTAQPNPNVNQFPNMPSNDPNTYRFPNMPDPRAFTVPNIRSQTSTFGTPTVGFWPIGVTVTETRTPSPTTPFAGTPAPQPGRTRLDKDQSR